ncbi:hypothetical protein B0H11DRAFT_2032587, partial [Mycena galericulata]
APWRTMLLCSSYVVKAISVSPTLWMYGVSVRHTFHTTYCCFSCRSLNFVYILFGFTAVEFKPFLFALSLF